MSGPDNNSSVGPLSPIVKSFDQDLGGGTIKSLPKSPPQSLKLSYSENLPMLLITANVGSMFDDPDNLIPQWLAQVCQQITAQRPAFVAIHCQEVNTACQEI